MIVNSRTYKNHKIEKVVKGNIRDPKHGYHIEYYTVDGKGVHWYLRDAKAAVDNMWIITHLGGYEGR